MRSNRIFKYFLVFFVGLLIGFVTPKLLVSRGSKMILKNNTQKSIETVKIETLTDIQTVESIMPGSEKETKIYPNGEGSYKLFVTFEDGKTISTQGKYVVTGEQVIETIENV